MHEIFKRKTEALAALCRLHGARRLELFGSAATGAFDPERSDLDALVQVDSSPARPFDRYFGLKEALESHFRGNVDLVNGRRPDEPERHRCGHQDARASMQQKALKLL